MAGHYPETFCPSMPWSEGDRPGQVEGSVGNSKGRGHTSRWSPNFELIDGLLYRKKLERGFINYREVLNEGRRHEAISTFHQRRPGQRHLSLEETYKFVAENYWWEGMYFQIRDLVLDCPECQSQRNKKSEELSGRGCVTKTMSSHSVEMLSRLRSQREAGLFCDITLRTNGRSFSAHRAVLAAVSDHFQEIFTEMDSSLKTDIDLTGFSEDSLLSLLDFSYSSTLCVRPEDLPEVIAMARHLGMWPAVEACSALIREQEQQLHPGKRFTLACAGACRERHHLSRESKRKRSLGLEHDMNDDFSLTLDASDQSFEEPPRRNLRRMPKSPGLNGLPLSPSHRMKLMDFKSPSSKKSNTPRHAIAASQSRSYSPVSPSNTRLLRSSPGAAKEVQKLLPKPETPRRNRKSLPATRCSSSSRTRASPVCSPVRVKQEVEELGEDEEDYARAQEKYKLLFVLGLQRTSLLPRPEDLIGWRQKKRLRKLKANNYSLTKRRKPRPSSSGLPYGDVTLALPLCNPVNTRLLNKSMKTKPGGPVSTKLVASKKRNFVSKRCVPPSDRSMRSKGVLPDLFQLTSRPAFGGRDLRRSVRQHDGAHHHPPLQRKTTKNHVRNSVRIKAEPETYCISELRLSSTDYSDHTPSKIMPSQRTRGRNKLTVEAVKTLRYNSGRPPTKAKPKRSSAKEVEKSKVKLRPEGRRAANQGPRTVMDTRLKTKDKEPDGVQFPENAPPPSIYNHPLYKVIKEEPADPVPVGGPFPDPPSPDLGKRQSKPPIKLLDSGFLFSFCRPAGVVPIAGLKKEEESVDICLTRSVSQVRQKFEADESPHRKLRARGPSILPVVKKEREERKVSQVQTQRPKPNSRNTNCAGSRPTRTMPKQQHKVPAVDSRRCANLDAVRRARLKQLRGPRSQAPKVPKAAHACLQCPASYQDCDALIMHRLRHIEGKHWPCPLCSKNFFLLRNVRNHIRTHDPKLYKCRSCIVAGS